MSLRMKYFVLKPGGDSKYAAASRAAMHRFAEHLERTAGDDAGMAALAEDVKAWVLEETVKVKGPLSLPD